MKHYLLNCYLFGQIMYYVLRFIHYRRHSPPLNNNQLLIVIYSDKLCTMYYDLFTIEGIVRSNNNLTKKYNI
jgi:hypothetical protein